MARTKQGVPSDTEEEYLAEARRPLRSMAGNFDLPEDGSGGCACTTVTAGQSAKRSTNSWKRPASSRTTDILPDPMNATDLHQTRTYPRQDGDRTA
ncbi:hypothetical protein [Geodermatophilus ruber]|uniref:Uncharacterized protein n=1 Tax=Geodermatophilus ruber TaxID=504800 RepID=A0A1I4GRG7_9ACTN|nr:hypothetical protein [Geodermatophilus ruber]SFL32575.1 hypothetical protein SAMN04488085_109145 [Geodermatophilus ruber]